MRKSIDTMLLIILLIGPSIILTCVRQPNSENNKTAEVEEQKEVSNETVLYAEVDMSKP